MDTTEQYVKMCEKAEEIQAEWKPRTADFYCYAGKIHTIHNYLADQVKTYGDIWLPRQDQLQEMIGIGTEVGLQTACISLYDFSTGAGCGITVGGSMEQLWLAFVMKERWGKIWRDDDWMKEG